MMGWGFLAAIGAWCVALILILGYIIFFMKEA